jgi:putative flippase GtrA
MLNSRLILRMTTYAGVGAFGTAAQYLVLVSFVSLGHGSPTAGSVTGAIVGAIVNYALNRRITFKSKSNHRDTLPKFAATAALGVLLNGLVMKVLAEDHQVNYLIAQIIATGLVLMLTFVINSIWTFRQQRTPGNAGL